MDKSKIESKLTPAAKETLQQIYNDFQDTILVGAYEAAANYSQEVKEITSRDILESASKNYQLRTAASHKQFDKITRVLVVFGVIYMFSGIGYMVYSNFRHNLIYPNLLVLVISVVGLISAFVGLFFNFYSKKKLSEELKTLGYRRDYTVNTSMELIQKWMELELLLRNFAADSYGESATNIPLTKLIFVLEKNQTLSHSEVNNLKSLLEVRNAILHNKTNIDTVEMPNLIRKADELIKAISSLPKV